MTLTQNGSLRVARVAGIDVWVHWSWLVLAVVAIDWRRGVYDSELWNAIEYLSLFGIVLLHEFGHALACRQVGGHANTIVLWPLGGAALVSPPPRPAAQLWSIVAGPLVNFALIPVIYFTGRTLVMTDTFTGQGYADFWIWLGTMADLNKWLLVFNLLPLFPLDGGQILRCLLWFGVGPRRSLLWAAGLGLVGSISLAAWALLNAWWWLGIVALFLTSVSGRTMAAARAGR